MDLVVCPGCGENRSAASLEDERGFARCPDCNAVFLLEASFNLEPSPRASFRRQRIEAPKECATSIAFAPRPTNDYRSMGNHSVVFRDLTVSWRYRHHSPGLVLFVGLTMTVVTFSWVSIAVEKELPLYLLLALGAPFAMLSMGFLYSFALATMDWMRLTLHRGTLELTAGPLPMPKAGMRVDARAIRDVYVRKTEVVSSSPSSDRTISATYFELRMFLGSGEGQRIAQFRDVETALYVSQCLNDALGLPPGPSDRLIDKMQSFRDFHRGERERRLPR